MAKKVKITEKMRKEIRDQIAMLEPDCRWHLIARAERESVEEAYIRVDEEYAACTFTDDGVTSRIYSKCRGMILVGERGIEWLEKNDLWCGAKLQPGLGGDEEQESDSSEADSNGLRYDEAP